MNPVHRDAEPSTSPSLLRSAQRGDADGWRAIAHIYGPIVYAWARRCGCQSADAADVMQETLTSMTAALPRYDHNRPDATFRGWLWTITRNKIRDHNRRCREQALGGTAANLRLHNVADPASDPCDDVEPPNERESDLTTARGRALALLRDKFDPRTWQMS